MRSKCRPLPTAAIPFPAVALILLSAAVRAESILPGTFETAGEAARAFVSPEPPEAWVVSTRGLPASCPVGVDAGRFAYQRLAGDCSDWVRAAPEDFLADQDPSRPLVVFIHGNRTDRCEAVGDGLPVFRRLKTFAPDRPFRLVIWSWPSDRIGGGPRHDALVKAARSDAQSYYLASWLAQLDGETPVLLMGYSFGARIITGALHLVEGGTLCGWRLEGEGASERIRPMRVMLIAAAVDSEWLLPESRNGMAFRHVDQMLITRNCRDPVLRLYPRMRRNDRSSALGYAGPAGTGRLLAEGLRFESVGVECQVGRHHDWELYFASQAVRSRLAWYAFLLDPSEPNG